MKFWSFIGYKSANILFSGSSKLLYYVLLGLIIIVIVSVFFVSPQGTAVFPSYDKVVYELGTRAEILSDLGVNLHEDLSSLSTTLHELDEALESNPWRLPTTFGDTLTDPFDNVIDDNIFSRIYFGLGYLFHQVSTLVVNVFTFFHIFVLLIVVIFDLIASFFSTFSYIITLPFAFF